MNQYQSLLDVVGDEVFCTNQYSITVLIDGIAVLIEYDRVRSSIDPVLIWYDRYRSGTVEYRSERF